MTLNRQLRLTKLMEAYLRKVKASFQQNIQTATKYEH